MNEIELSVTATPAEIQGYLESKVMKPLSTPVGIVELDDEPLESVGGGTTGLMEGRTTLNRIDDYDINVHVIKNLHGLNFAKYVPEFYDCEDRAFWGMAHLRHFLPGVPIGVASGVAQDGPIAGKPHAVIIIWRRGPGGDIVPEFWDPLPEHQGLVGFGGIQSIVAFPADVGKINTPPIVNSLNGSMLVYDRKRVAYRREDLLNYLRTAPYEKNCVNAKLHQKSSESDFNSWWSRSDRALWAFVHARRDYPGCPVGVAKGNKVSGDSTWLVTVFYKNDTGDLEWTYFDPKSSTEVKNFNPTMIFI